MTRSHCFFERRSLRPSILALMLLNATAFSEDAHRPAQAAAASRASDSTGSMGTWHCVQPHAPWTPRDTAENAVFRGKMWLSNGWAPKPGSKTEVVDTRDLWNTSDGVNWTMVSGSTPYDLYSEMVVFKGKLWAIKASVWNTADGEHWERVLEKTPFGALGYGEALVLHDRIWELGSTAEVWSTPDGVAWEAATTTAPYGKRFAQAAAVFKDRIWLMAGSLKTPATPPEKGYKNMTTFNDVWSSPDGQHWTRELEHAPWAPRMWSVAIAYAGRLWLIGGYANTQHKNLGDVWTTRDGRTWEQFRSPTSFAPRHEVTPYVYQGSLWVVAGNTWPVVNDVWRLTLPELDAQRK